MRITEVSLWSDDTKLMGFSLRSGDSNSRYKVRQIIGMDVDEITPRFYGFGAVSGQRFHEHRIPKRELVILVGLNPSFMMNEEYGDVRDDIYRAISTGRSGMVNVRFHSGAGILAQVNGFVTKLESGYFNKLPEVQLTIRCDEPMLRGMTPVVLGETELGYTNPISIPDSISTAPHGYSFDVVFTDQATDFQVNCPNGEWSFKIEPTSPFEPGDKLHLSSEFSKKKLMVERSGGGTEHLMNAVVSGSFWPGVFPGGSSHEFNRVGAFTWDELRYLPAFWGV